MFLRFSHRVGLRSRQTLSGVPVLFTQFPRRLSNASRRARYDEFGEAIPRSANDRSQQQHGGRGGNRSRPRREAIPREKEFKPFPGDWLCTRCETVNFRRNGECRECMLPVSNDCPRWSNEDGSPWVEVSVEMKAGDWHCVQCTFVNFKNRTDCFRCLAPMVPDCPKVPLPPLTEEGQYYCAQCSTLNFSERTTCIKCGDPRPETAGAPVPRKRPGDWTCLCGTANRRANTVCTKCSQLPQAPGSWSCSECKEVNYKARVSCQKCNKAKSSACQTVAEVDSKHHGTIDYWLNAKPGDWLCSGCRRINTKFKSVCIFCRNIKDASCTTKPHGYVPEHSLPGDWLCVECNGNNHADSSSCHRCMADRSPHCQVTPVNAISHVPLPGDWNCAGCHTHNFRNRNECRTCKRSRDNSCTFVRYGKDESKSLNKAVPGDWQCCKCLTINFRSRSKCLECDSDLTEECKVAPERTWDTSLPGDWQCTGCKSMNFRGRTECVSCSKSKDDKDAVVPVVLKTGEYVCPSCRTLNYRFRTECAGCGVSRASKPGTLLGAIDSKIGQFVCSKCSTKNFSWRKMCHSCHAPRPDTLDPTEQNTPVSSVMDIRDPNTTPRPGDWKCEHCSNLNLPNRLECRRCKENNPKAQQWRCHNTMCRARNDGTLSICSECHQKRVKTPKLLKC